MKGEITLDGAIALLSSDKAKDRTDGLADLKHILLQNKRNSKLLSLSDKASHRIFETLFRFISTEKQVYNRGAKTTASSRLSACASVIRTAVDALLSNLRTKSVRAVLDHITDVLVSPGSDFFELLSVDYTKCLSTVLHYPAHVEHLSVDEWEAVMHFCLKILNASFDDDSQQNTWSAYSTLDDYLGASGGRSTPSRMTPGLALREKPKGSMSAIEEALLCIRALSGSPNAPIQENAESILLAMAKYVRSSRIAGSSHQTAFSTINTVVMRVIFDNAELTRNTLLDLIPAVRHHWATKLIGLRDELLVTTMFVVTTLTNDVQQNPTEALKDAVDGLVETVRHEYSRRPEKDILQVDELSLASKTQATARRFDLWPRLEIVRSDHNWTVVWVIARLLEASEALTSQLSFTHTDGETPNKRQRLASKIDDVFRDAVSSFGAKRLCALQLIPFLPDHYAQIEPKTSLLERLIPSIHDDNTTLSSWTMIAIASIAASPKADVTSLKRYWQQAWDLTTRALTSQSTSRAACHLLNIILHYGLLDYSAVSETVNSMLSFVNLNGPATLSDASLDLWATVVRMIAQTNPGSASHASGQICAWLRDAWTVGSSTDRTQTSQIAAFARPLELLNLFMACTNRTFRRPRTPFKGPTGIVAKCWYFHHTNKQIWSYLFDVREMLDVYDIWNTDTTLLMPESPHLDPNDSGIIDLLHAKSDHFLLSWQSVSEDKSRHVTSDILQIFTSFCMTVALYLSCLPKQPESRMQALTSNNNRLWEHICSFFAVREPTFVVPSLLLFPPFLPLDSCFLTSKNAVYQALYELVMPLSGVLERYRQSSKETLSTMNKDIMDLDDAFLTSTDQYQETSNIMSTQRSGLPLFQDSASFQRHMTILFSMFQRAYSQRNFSQLPHVGETLNQYLTSLDEADILAAHEILPYVYRSCSDLQRNSLLELFEDLGAKCLQSYGLERCENSHIVCIRMMDGLARTWASDIQDDLSDSAADIYHWFTGVFLKKGKTSSSVMTAFAELLGKILSLSPNYLSSQSSQSPRTTLFKLVGEGDVLVKFRAGGLIPPLFGQFIFKDHDAIFNDVLECLPRDPEWEEGIAVRLFLLSQLASKWHTLLRRSIYHIFETPAQIRHSLPYAEKCLRHVADALGLQDSREIFRLFSSQILYTWAETQSVLSMPFSIFGYASLEDMLSDVQDEVVGQIMMRASEKDAAEFSKFMDQPFVELLANSFYKAEAYTISRDISTPPGQGSQPKGVENRLKKILGGQKLVNLAETQFPQIASTFFVTLDLYEQAERAFSKRAEFRGALDIFRRITANESVKIALPANQQPSFRARYLLDELEFLCRRSGYELETIWTPALASYVCRTLLESIHPALGSLHTCSVLRKIKVLLCVAGPVMLSDYPFEMIIHGIQPFLVDIFCFDDAQAMVRYLLEAGRPHLVDDPSLMAGIAVSISLSLGRFLESPPASPGLESHLEVIMHKLRSFYSWFQEYVDAYESPTLDKESSESFRRLIGSLQTMAGQAPGSRDASESQLLLEALRDRDSQNGLLSEPISDRVISLLCTTFSRSTDYHLAAIKKDEDAVSTAFTVCETLKDFNTSKEYRSWAARVIGKAFAATGKINDSLLREQELALFHPYLSRSNIDLTCRSKANILQLLCNMLLNSDQTGLIERTLQLIVSNLANFPTFRVCASDVPSSLMKALTWEPYQCPEITLSALEARKRDSLRGWDLGLSPLDWARNVGLFLSKTAAEDPVIGPLDSILYLIPHLATQLLPYILHDALLAECRGEIHVRKDISHIFKTVLQNDEDRTVPHARLVIGCILYLRDQPRPDEHTIVERDSWLDIDYAVASSAASRCRLPKTALLFLELHASRSISGSRRSSVAKYEPPQGLLHDIFKNIDDPDFFYGIQQKSSLESVIETLEHESSGLKNLLFQSAQYDSQLQITGSGTSYGVLKALNSTNLQGISNTMLGSLGTLSDSAIPIDDMLKAATNLRQWDIPVSPLNTSPSATIFRAFQSLNTSGALVDMRTSIEDSFANSLNLIDSGRRSAASLRTAMRTLGILTEIEEVLNSKTTDEVDERWRTISARTSWLQNTHVQEVGEILSSHETLFSSVKQKDHLKSAFNLTDQDAQLLEVKVIRQSIHIARNHGIPQSSLKSAVYLSKLSDQCVSLDLNVEGVTKFDLANVLWDQGEMAPSIQILQQLKDRTDLHKQAIPISRAEILVTLGHHIAEARLEKPEAIIQNYLTPAVKELKGHSEAEDAGRVYHGFATFCDQQLQNPDGLEDFNRIEQLRNLKEKEVLSLDAMLKTAEGKERDNLKFHRSKTKQWFDLDDREYQRLKRSREAFLEQCLENYLICLKASEAYNNDVLRFVALWLDQSYLDIANNAVSKYLADVPSRKFAPLMNQLTSRLLDVSDDFQSLLSALIFRICCEHPFHGMYQIFAGSKSRVGKDQSALSRNRAASNLADILRNDKQIGTLWVTVHNANVNYVRFAVERLDDKMKSGAKVPLKKLAPGQRLEQDAVAQRLPPPTMKIDIRVDCDYNDVPKLVRYQSEFTIASGVSAPKIVTAIASNGVRYKQLFKGGNDDLRQDAIMEQVFEQVSSLLKEHQATRQRNLGIRAYKVLPLTSNAGIIEFVPNTIPLNEYLMPAHQKYYPKDMKPNACRKHIADVQTRSFEHRARIYRQVAEHFHPVLRYFFMEKFNNPDDWFGRRLSYTQSTAAISMLGHVLGLGDRHGHNILLDERTGEVVHIDLGVAFEQGRVLPVPEVVPFRLTRDLVDGMGIAKTEGVFRRCCEFTLEALRQESYSIMTILDVLRYDPLYSWTVSPLRMKKMQEQDPGDQPPVLAGTTGDQRPTNEPSEADRALTVVAKKLSKTLSVTATVNELIQQATDEKNLAVLYCGWAAYA
ncbi:DNA-binding protein kinase TEL1 [Aspergillus stella-maris]|uniref:DNA-binding protein kinase TEL1 n=1 Tax=Aspergillus stella-maris TaxID=1810926 RepID=UPI003CCCF6D4